MRVVPLHRDRAATIGGSDAAAACGVDPYRSPLALWVEKTGRDPEGKLRPYTEAMRWGQLLEPVVMAALVADGVAVSPWHVSHLPMVDPAREWLTGTPDGFVNGDNDDDRRLLEVKTTNAWAHRANGGVPAHHNVQVQHYLHLTGLSRALLAVLVNGQHLEVHEVPRDDAAIALLLELEERFHWHVVTDTQPAAGEHDKETLAVLHPAAEPARLVRLDKAGMRLDAELRARKEQLRAVKEQVDALESRAKALLGDAETAVSPNDREVWHWTNTSSTRLDQARVKKVLPNWEQEFSTTTQTRRFTVA